MADLFDNENLLDLESLNNQEDSDLKATPAAKFNLMARKQLENYLEKMKLERELADFLED